MKTRFLLKELSENTKIIGILFLERIHNIEQDLLEWQRHGFSELENLFFPIPAQKWWPRLAWWLTESAVPILGKAGSSLLTWALPSGVFLHRMPSTLNWHKASWCPYNPPRFLLRSRTTVRCFLKFTLNLLTLTKSVRDFGIFQDIPSPCT